MSTLAYGKKCCPVLSTRVCHSRVMTPELFLCRSQKRLGRWNATILAWEAETSLGGYEATEQSVLHKQAHVLVL